MRQPHFVQHKLLALDGGGLAGHPGLRQLARVRVAHLEQIPENGVLRLLSLRACSSRATPVKPLICAYVRFLAKLGINRAAPE